MTCRFIRSRGFSLIELVFSMAIGSIILLLAATMLGLSGDSYERLGGTVASEREARALMTQLAADLSTAHFHKDSVSETSSSTWPTDRLGFLSLQPAAAQSATGGIGDLCAIHYYVQDLTMNGRTVRCLMRGFHESKNTFAAMKEDTMATLFAPPTGDLNSSADEPVAFGVMAFQARPKSSDPSGKLIDWTKNDITPPEWMEVELTIARRDLTGRLKTPADWNGVGEARDALGNAADANSNKSLEVYRSILCYGNHTIP